MADIENDKKAVDALETEAEGTEGERKAQPTVSDLMKNAAAALGDFDDEVTAAPVVAAPTVAEEGTEIAAESAEVVEAIAVSEAEAKPAKKSRRKDKSAKAKEAVEALSDEGDVSALAAAAAEAMSEVQVEALESQAEAQPVEALEAEEAALQPESEVEAAPEEETSARKGKAEKKSGKKGKKKSKDVEWTAETRDLDFVPDAVNEEGEALAAEEPALNAFEELARRVAATVSESSDESAESVAEAELDAAEMEASDAILAELAASESAEALEVAVTEVEASAADAVSESSGDMEQLGLEAMSVEAVEEELDAAENDAAAEPAEFVEHDQLVSIIESLLFSTDKPVSIATIKQIFKGSNIRTKDITRALDLLASEYASPMRGVTLEEINGGYQLRTKVDNAEFLRRLAKTRPFRLSGPALEVMAIVAYKQPITKHEIDEIRGVESGHLLRALMERHLVSFSGKAENLPGKPMTYSSTRKFLEIFGLRNLKELPTLSEIDELLPEGIGEVEEKETLSELTDRLSTELTSSYSEGEDELTKINEQLQQIDTTSEFFEQEKQRERERRDRERAQDLREKLVLGDQVDEKDRRWLDRYETRLQEVEAAAQAGQTMTIPADEVEAAPEVGDQLQALSEEAAQSAAALEEDAEDDLSDLEDDLAVNLDWSEDGESGGEGDKD